MASARRALPTVSTPLPVIGDLDMQPDAQDAPFNRSKIALQPSTTLELMALAQFAVAAGRLPRGHDHGPGAQVGSCTD